jgi:pentatricopeptide repeat protein
VNKLNKVKELLNEMDSKGILPNTVTFNIIVDAICKMGEADEAEKLLCNMLDKGAKPNIIIYTSIINGYSKLGAGKIQL